MIRRWLALFALVAAALVGTTQSAMATDEGGSQTLYQDDGTACGPCVLSGVSPDGIRMKFVMPELAAQDCGDETADQDFGSYENFWVGMLNNGSKFIQGGFDLDQQGDIEGWLEVFGLHAQNGPGIPIRVDSSGNITHDGSGLLFNNAHFDLNPGDTFTTKLQWGYGSNGLADHALYLKLLDVTTGASAIGSFQGSQLSTWGVPNVYDDLYSSNNDQYVWDTERWPEHYDYPGDGGHDAGFSLTKWAASTPTVPVSNVAELQTDLADSGTTDPGMPNYTAYAAVQSKAVRNETAGIFFSGDMVSGGYWGGNSQIHTAPTIDNLSDTFEFDWVACGLN